MNTAGQGDRGVARLEPHGIRALVSGYGTGTTGGGGDKTGNEEIGNRK